ncbi:MAG: zinc ribbon domain-containing protein [Anaerolineae bacterium]
MEPRGPFCQSCGMPMEKPEDFGTNAGGSKSGDYCHFCFQNGMFTEPDITMEQMIDKVTGIMVTQMKMPKAQAEGMMKSFLPQLKRWKSK